MIRKTLIAIAVAGAIAVMSQAAIAQTTGPNSSASPYLQSTDGGLTSYTSILTTGDKISNYMMAGIPDGLGAYDNGNGTFTVLMNHEIGETLGVARGPLTKGSFISEWVINKSDLSVISGGDLIKNVYGWDTALQASSVISSAATFNRFCSADLAPTTAFYNASTGLGSQARIFMNGEEGGANGRALATVATGVDKGNTYVLGKMNQATNGSGITAVGAWENLLANPIAQNKTVIIGNNDGGTGMMNNSLAVYVGTKQSTGSEVAKAGLTNGVTKFVSVTGNAVEINNATTRTTGIADGTRFTLSTTASTTFSRPEDGAWSKDGRTYYFVTTDQLDATDTAGGTAKGGTRLWSLSFDDIANVDAGGSIRKLIDTSTNPGGLGVVKPNMFDNVSVSNDGKTITLLEDVGNANHNGKVWNYSIADGSLTMVGKFDPARFGDVAANGSFTAGSHTKDEETSGVIDVTDILGRNDGNQYNLLVAQDHTLASAAVLGIAAADQAAAVEGGQLLLMTTPVPEPESYGMMLAGLGMLAGVAGRRRNRR